MDLMRWNPELSRMREDLRQMFPDSQMWPFAGLPFFRMHGPSIDVRETKNEIIVSAEIPGVDPEEVEVTVNESQITLSGEVKREGDHEKEGYRVMERRWGTFNRTVQLPAEVKPDEATAEYKNGVLEIRLNKSDHGRERSRRLEIKKSH